MQGEQKKLSGWLGVLLLIIFNGFIIGWVIFAITSETQGFNSLELVSSQKTSQHFES